MIDVLVLAILASFLIQVAPTIDQTTFVVTALGLAVAAGLGGGRLLRGPLSVAALIAWLSRELARESSIAWIYIGLVGALLLCYLFGKLVKATAYALPLAVLLAVVGLSYLGGVVGR